MMAEGIPTYRETCAEYARALQIMLEELGHNVTWPPGTPIGTIADIAERLTVSLLIEKNRGGLRMDMTEVTDPTLPRHDHSQGDGGGDVLLAIHQTTSKGIRTTINPVAVTRKLLKEKRLSRDQYRGLCRLVEGGLGRKLETKEWPGAHLEAVDPAKLEAWLREGGLI